MAQEGAYLKKSSDTGTSYTTEERSTQVFHLSTTLALHFANSLIHRREEKLKIMQRWNMTI